MSDFRLEKFFKSAETSKRFNQSESVYFTMITGTLHQKRLLASNRDSISDREARVLLVILVFKFCYPP